MDQEKAIVIWTEHRDGYFHIYGSFAFVGTGSTPEYGRYQEVTKDKTMIDGLRITSQGNDREYNGETTARKLYGWEIIYKDIYSVDARRAEAMYKTLSMIDKKTTKIRDAQGYPKTIGQFIGQIAQALKIDRFYFKRDDPQYGLGEYVLCGGIGDCVSRIDSLEYQWKRAGLSEGQESTAQAS